MPGALPEPGYSGAQTQGLLLGSPPACSGGRHVNRQLQHNVISVLPLLWAKPAAAKAGSLGSGCSWPRESNSSVKDFFCSPGMAKQGTWQVIDKQ